MRVHFTRAYKNVQILTLTAVLIRTCKRQSFTFQSKNAKESQGGSSEMVGIEGCW